MFRLSSCLPGRVREVAFSLLSNEDIASMSSMEVTTDSVWGAKGPVDGGLLDQRLGAVSEDFPCFTCHGVFRSPDVLSFSPADGPAFSGECPGHMGHMTLPVPVFTPTSEDAAVKVLASFCWNCGASLVTPAKMTRVREELSRAFTDLERLKIMYTAARVSGDKARMCVNGCKRMLPFITVKRRTENGSWFHITAEFPSLVLPGAERTDFANKTLAVTALRAEAALARVRPESLAADFGMFSGDVQKARQFLDSLVLRVLPVPPPCVRPTHMHQGKASSTHALTQKLQDIFFAARTLRAIMTQSNAPSRLTSFLEMTYGMRHTLDKYAALQFYVHWTMDASSAGRAPEEVPRKKLDSAEKSSISFATNLNGKRGRVRGNLMGKRVDFTARTVITGDPGIPFGAVALPASMCDVLTVPERVTPRNRIELMREAMCVVTEHMSTRSVFSADGKSRRDLRRNPHTVGDFLEVGQIVERRLRDGDIVILNRQPTLHGPSMQALTVVRQERKTIAFNLSMTAPFNADFDGDEMNVHVPQTLQAQAEARTLMRSVQQLLLPAKGAPCMGLVQDSLLAMRLMSRRDQFFARDEAMQLMMNAACEGMGGVEVTFSATDLPRPAIVRPVALWTGKQLISCAFPETLTELRGKETFAVDTPASARDDTVIVVRGELISGRLCKRTVGASGGSFQHAIATSAAYGSDGEARYLAVASFFNSLKTLSAEFLLQRGFSIGIGDVSLLCPRVTTQRKPCFEIAPSQTFRPMCENCQLNVSIGSAVRRTVDEVAGRIRKRALPAAGSESVSAGRGGPTHPEVALDQNIIETERFIITRQDKARDTCAEETLRVVEGRLWRVPNATVEMLRAGSKGNTTTLAQMAVMVGGQMIKGARVVDNHVSLGPAPPPVSMRLNGSLTRSVYGRDIAWSRFRASSHFTRSYPGACEGGFVQQSFVGGLDPWAFFSHARGGRQGLIDTALNTAQSGYLQRRMMKGVVDLVVAYDGTVRNTNNRVIQFSYGANPAKVRGKPFAPATEWSDKQVRERLFWRDNQLCAALREEGTAVARAVDVLRACIFADRDGTTLRTTGSVRSVFEGLCPPDRVFAADKEVPWGSVSPETPGVVSASECAALLNKWFSRMTRSRLFPDQLHECEARVWVNSRQIVGKWAMPSDCGALQELLLRLEAAYAEARVQPGEAVGAVAAMSMGEPTTQMTLNSFHAAGTTASKIGGVDRCNELILASKEQKTPVVRTFLRANLADKAEAAWRANWACVESVPTMAMPHETVYDLTRLLRLCPVDTAPPVLTARGADAFVCGLEPAVAFLPGEVVSCAVTLWVFDVFGQFFAHTVAVRGGSAVVRVKGSFPLRETLPPDMGELVCVVREKAAKQGLRVGAFARNVRNEQALLDVVRKRCEDACPGKETRTARWVRKRAHYAALVPLQRELETRLMGSFIRDVTIDYHPVREQRWGDTGLHLTPHGAPQDEVDRWSLDEQFEVPGSRAGQAGRKRKGDETGHRDEWGDNVTPACVGESACPWKGVLGRRCLSNFACTLHLHTRWLEASGVTPMRLEEDLARGPLSGAYLVHVGDPSLAEGTTPLRIRARMCKAYSCKAKSEKEALLAVDECEALKEMAETLRGVRISGPPDTRNVSMSEVVRRAFDTGTGAVREEREVALDVATTDLRYVLSMGSCDQRRTTTNMVHKACSVMGVEAARTVLVREFEEMVASGSCYVDRHHIALMADTMLSTGAYTSFKYADMAALRDDVLMQASYEQQAQTLRKAAVNGTRVPIVSPAAAIYVGGLVPRLGTNACAVILDTDAIREGIEVPDEAAAERAEELKETRRLKRATMSPLPQISMGMPKHEEDSWASPARFDSPGVGTFSPGPERFVSFMEISQAAAQETQQAIRRVVDEHQRVSSSPPSFQALYSPSYAPSPAFSPASPAYSPSSPAYNPSSPAYSPSSPAYSPSSPTYSPSSPAYSPSSPAYGSSSPAYSPSSPNVPANVEAAPGVYSPTSPTYQPAEQLAYDMQGLVFEEASGRDMGSGKDAYAESDEEFHSDGWSPDDASV